MSNIFNLLGGLAESSGDQIKPIARSKTSHEIRLNSFKTMRDTKPKGLSIRSNSDMNISNIYSTKKSTYDKEWDCSKLKVTQIDNHGRPISPGKEVISVKSSKFKDCALKDTAINKYTKKHIYDDIFKKPLLPKKNVKKFPKPEKLAHWYDDEYNFDYEYIEAVEKQFKDLVSKQKEIIKPCEENMLVSDSEILLLAEIELNLDKTLDEELLSPNLLEVSDVSDISDDDENL